jgi:GNAT superfamily N-acetyltransferase
MVFMEMRLSPVKRRSGWRRGAYEISTDRRRLQLDVVHGFLRTAYWCRSVPRVVVERAINGSLCFGLYHGTGQIGFARVVTDRVTFSWICDVFIAEEHRKRGLGTWLVSCVVVHPWVRHTRCTLGTRDAHGLYEKFGFVRHERMVRPADPRVS